MAIELIYSQQSDNYVKGRAYSNPRFFTTPRSDVSKVYVVGDWPKIHEAYEALGVPVERLDKAPVAEAEKPARPSALVGPEDLVERDAVVIPDGWADLGWSKPNEDGLTLRGLATSVSSTPILNKADASAAIEAELARRAAAGVVADEEQPAAE